MNRRGLQQLVRLGEDSSRQFKADVTNPDSLAAELVAFSNSRGGTILIGVADDGTLVGLSAQDVRRINQLIGNSVIRNPVLASFAAKGVLPYRGLGTGIRRALADWPAVDLIDDRDGCTFTATVRLTAGRNAPITGRNAPINAPITGQNAPINLPGNAPLADLQRSMLDLIACDPSISYDALGTALKRDRTTVMRNIRALKTLGLLRREGSRKTGRWVIGN